jgi:ketosteroid isomerase-like protein
MSNSAISVLVVTALFYSFAQPTSQRITRSSESERAVRKLERDWLDAYEHYDAKAMDSIVAGHFTITHADGSLQTKAQIMASLKRASDSAKSPSTFSTEDVQALVYQDTVILIGRVVERSRGEGQPIVSEARYTDTYVKQEGRWRVVASQLTALLKRNNF